MFHGMSLHSKIVGRHGSDCALPHIAECLFKGLAQSVHLAFVALISQNVCVMACIAALIFGRENAPPMHSRARNLFGI